MDFSTFQVYREGQYKKKLVFNQELIDSNHVSAPTFKFKYSKTIGSKYFANTCPICGVISGDFFLHSEPGVPFFPTDEEEASLLYQAEIPLEGPIIVHSGLHRVLACDS